MASSRARNVLLATAALSRLVNAVPSPSSLGSDLQILLHNDLYGKSTSFNRRPRTNMSLRQRKRA